MPAKARDLAAFARTEPGNDSRPSRTSWSSRTLTAPKFTIQGGTTEVLRGIIARGLGLR